MYQVVINEEEQYSIWPDGRALPAGWAAEGTTGTREECLAHIDRVWTDITPRSVRTGSAPRSVRIDGTPRSVRIDGTPRSVRTDGTPRSVRTGVASRSVR